VVGIGRVSEWNISWGSWDSGGVESDISSLRVIVGKVLFVAYRYL
jgi:hypothetical protein